MTSQLSEHIITCIHYFNTMAAGPPAPHKHPAMREHILLLTAIKQMAGALLITRSIMLKSPLTCVGAHRGGEGLARVLMWWEMTLRIEAL